MSSSHTTASSMPIMPSPSAAIGQPQSPTLLQPLEHHLDSRASFETLTSIASSNPNSASTQLRRPACYSAFPNTSEHNPPRAADARPRPILRQHHLKRFSNTSLPPVRDLPPLHTPHEEIHWNCFPFEADKFEQGSSDEEMIPAGLDLSLGKLYGFPYCLGVSDAMEQRSRAVAEAEEAEYQREKDAKRKARLSGRMSTALKGVSMQNALSWTKRSQR